MDQFISKSGNRYKDSWLFFFKINKFEMTDLIFFFIYLLLPLRHENTLLSRSLFTRYLKWSEIFKEIFMDSRCGWILLFTYGLISSRILYFIGWLSRKVRRIILSGWTRMAKVYCCIYETMPFKSENVVNFKWHMNISIYELIYFILVTFVILNWLIEWFKNFKFLKNDWRVSLAEIELVD